MTNKINIPKSEKKFQIQNTFVPKHFRIRDTQSLFQKENNGNQTQKNLWVKAARFKEVLKIKQNPYPTFICDSFSLFTELLKVLGEAEGIAQMLKC
jgi:hypothetical protein